MIFHVVSPLVATIDGDTFKDAVKNFVKLHHHMSLSEIIIADQLRKNYMKANVNYYYEGNRNKVGINLIPWTVNANGNLIPNAWPYVPTITYDTTEYSPTTYIEAPFMPAIVPLGPLVSPLQPLLPGLVVKY